MFWVDRQAEYLMFPDFIQNELPNSASVELEVIFQWGAAAADDHNVMVQQNGHCCKRRSAAL